MQGKPLYSVVSERNNKRVGKIVRYVTAKITTFNGKTSRFTRFTKKKNDTIRQVFHIVFIFWYWTKGRKEVYAVQLHICESCSVNIFLVYPFYVFVGLRYDLNQANTNWKGRKERRAGKTLKLFYCETILLRIYTKQHFHIVH